MARLERGPRLPWSAMTDPAGLLARAASGEEAAGREVVARYQALVHAVIRAHRIAAPDGEDLFQEVFLRLHRHALRIQDPGALAGWVAVTTRNLCLDHLARRRRLAELEDSPEPEDPAPGIESELERHGRAQQVREALEELSPACRELLFVLYYEMDEPDYRRAADRLGRPVGSIGPTRQRCLARLLEVLERRRIPDES